MPQDNSDNYADDPQFQEWAGRVRAELIPKLEDSAMTVSLVPSGETDVKFAVELGMSIMMDKPIIAVVSPGSKVPNHLVRVADHIIEGDLESEAGRDRLGKTLQKLVQEIRSNE